MIRGLTSLKKKTKKKAGAKSVPLTEEVKEFLASLLFAPTWDESRTILDTHPELTDESAIAFLEEIEPLQTDPRIGVAIGENLGFLRRCREAGVARAHAERVLSAEHLAEAAYAGIPPETFLLQLSDDYAAPADLDQDDSAAKREQHLYE